MEMTDAGLKGLSIQEITVSINSSLHHYAVPNATEMCFVIVQ